MKTKPAIKWMTPHRENMPKMRSNVEVITTEGEQLLGTFEADDNWNIDGYPHDAFNNDIMFWRYIK